MSKIGRRLRHVGVSLITATLFVGCSSLPMPFELFESKMEVQVEPVVAEEETRTLSPQEGVELLKKQIGSQIDYLYKGTVEPDVEILGESGENFYIYYGAHKDKLLEGALYVNRLTGEIYTMSSTGNVALVETD